MTGKVEGSLVESTPAAFSYSQSVWPKPYGWQLDGWLVTAATGESLTFEAWAEQDAGRVPLGLVMYGPLVPLDGGADAASCSGPLESSGALVGPQIQWSAPSQGSYFAAPFHTVVETPSGLAFQGLDDSDYARAFIVMSASE